MRHNPLGAFLTGLFVLGALAVTVLTVTYVQATRNLLAMQWQAAIINKQRTLASALANDLVEYSRRNPMIDPILQSVGLKGRLTNAPALKSAK